jgi:transglutaminase-like putative cysteine protease
MRQGSRLRLVLRDLGSGFAFASMAVSGQLPVWTLALYGVSLVCALAGWRLFARRAKLTALLLLIAAVVLGMNVLAGGLNLVVAACAFAGLISAHRLLSSPEGATDGQVHLSGLLMVAGGAALSGELVYGLFLVVFSLLSSLSLALGVVEAAVPEGEPVPTREVMRPLAKGLGFAVAGAVAFFILFPRLNWNMMGPRSSPGLGAATAGFSNTVRLGGAGTIKGNPRIVLRSTLSPDPRKENLDAYWLGRTYDVFDGQEWTNAGKPRSPMLMVTLRPGGENLIHQRVELLPAYGARTAVALETPARLGNALAHTQTGSRRIGLQRLGGGELRFADAATSYSYEAYSLPPGGGGDTLDSLPPEEQDALLALPENLDARIAQTAARVLNGEREPLAAAQKLAAWLQREHQYTLELSGDVADPLADFLFVRKAGHCEHFATALTLMLRTQGLRARLATGFFGGERVADGYIVRAGDAHAWTHVLVPGRGFVTVDATPPSHRSSQSSVVLQRMIAFYEVVEARWRSAVVDYSFRDQLDFARTLVRPPRSRSGEATPSRLPPLRAWAAAVVAGLVAYGAWRGLARFLARERPHEATRFVDAVEAQLASARLEREEGETLEDLDARLAREGHPLSAALSPITRRYLEARFGGRPLLQGEATTLLATLKRAIAEDARRSAAEARPPRARRAS